MKVKNKQDRASRTILTASQQEEFPLTVEMLGLKLIIHKGVFSPKHFHGPEIFTRNFPIIREEEILEIGCGTGITGLYLAKHGAKKVTLVDISSQAVENSRKNAQKNNITNCEIKESNIFSAIKNEEKFDTIYWNMPFIPTSDNYQFESMLERALFDPGYKLLKQFLQEVSTHLRKQSRVLIGWGNSENQEFADPQKLKQSALQYGFSIKLLVEEPSIEQNPVLFQLYELRRKKNEK